MQENFSWISFDGTVVKIRTDLDGMEPTSGFDETIMIDGILVDISDGGDVIYAVSSSIEASEKAAREFFDRG
jgi:hypothetical protein